MRKNSREANEAAEAQWFEENQDRLLKLFEQAAKQGTLRVGTRSVGISISKPGPRSRTPPSRKVMLRIPEGDLDRARSQATRAGLRYQTYIKMLLHESLDRHERSRKP